MRSFLRCVFIHFLLILLVFPFLANRASAIYIADITYNYTDHGAGNYTFVFTVFNKSTGTDAGPLEYFEINFDADLDLSLYSNITWGDDNGWYSEAFEYDPGFGGMPGVSLADDSIFGSGGGGIAQGNSLGGFSVNFDYSGALGPDEQLLSWYAEFGTSDTDNGGYMMGDCDGIPNSGDEYWVLGFDDGVTGYAPSSVPEPSTLLLLLGLSCFGLLRSKKRG